jgi:hypothetical protein
MLQQPVKYALFGLNLLALIGAAGNLGWQLLRWILRGQDEHHYGLWLVLSGLVFLLCGLLYLLRRRYLPLAGIDYK